MLDDFIYFESALCNLRRSEIEVYTRVLRERLLPLSQDIDKQVATECDRLLEKWSAHFNPDIHDPRDFEELAYEEAMSYGINLCEINCYVLALGIAGLYHLWEKQIISHIKKEIGRYHPVPKIKGWEDIKKFLSFYSTKLEDIPTYNGINELRCVANAIKHSDGPSYNELKKMKADILVNSYEADFPIIGGKWSLLKVELYPNYQHVDRYSNALLAFWDYDYWERVGDKRYPSWT